MIESPKHKIRKASFQVDFEGLEKGLGIQDSLGLYFHEKLKPALQQLFDEYSTKDSILKIDKLDLDCGRIGIQNWENLLLEKMKEQMILNLKPILENPDTRIPPHQSAEEVFLYYLAKGFFPWNSPFPNIMALEQEIVLSERLISNLFRDYIFSEIPILRLTKSFSSDFLKKLTGMLIHDENGWIQQFLDKSFELPDFDSKIFRELTSCMLLSVSSQKTVDQKKLWNQLLSTIQENKEMLQFVLSELSMKTALQKSFGTFITGNDLKSEELNRLKDFSKTALDQNHNLALETWFKSLMAITETIDTILEINEGETQFQNVSNSDLQKLSKRLFQDSQSSIFESDLEDTIYVENAGMVLFHPFILPLFENIGLVKDGCFVSSEKQGQAVSILEYLVWGENKHTENYFPLNKILCGLYPSDLWESGVVLGQSSKEACEEMLLATISHWKALKNTGIGSLREAFLQRNGKLSRSNNGWKLTIEQKTVDVLLSNLPWGMGIIKLPWMKEMLYVEWN